MDENKELHIPDDFRYREVFLRGKPQHERFDEFGARHPKMTCGKRAKIFAPFDALKGFNEAVSAKDVVYVDRIELEQEAREDLDKVLGILHELTRNMRVAKENRVEVTVEYYVPCEDPESFSFGTKGLYKTVTGICWYVDTEDTRSVRVGEKNIDIDSLFRIEIHGKSNARSA